MGGPGAILVGCSRKTRGKPGAGAVIVAFQAWASGVAGHESAETLLHRPHRQNLARWYSAPRSAKSPNDTAPPPPTTEACLRVKHFEEARRIGRILPGLERHLQAGERVRMLRQVDLHATDIDRALAARLQCPHRRDGLRLGVVEQPLAPGIHRPWPGAPVPADWIPPPALHPPDRGQQMRRTSRWSAAWIALWQSWPGVTGVGTSDRGNIDSALACPPTVSTTSRLQKQDSLGMALTWLNHTRLRLSGSSPAYSLSTSVPSWCALQISLADE